MTIGGVSVETDDPAAHLRQVLENGKSPRLEGMPPFTGGLVGYFSYDFIGYSEPAARRDALDTEDFRDLDLMLFDRVIAFDNVRQQIILIVNISLDDPQTGYRRAALAGLSFPDGVFGADDWVFTMRVMAKVKRHATLPDVVYLHRSHADNISAAMPMQYILAMLGAVETVAAEWCDAPEGPRVPRAEFARSLSSHVQLWGMLLPCLKRYSASEKRALAEALARLRREGLLPFVSAGHTLRCFFVRHGLMPLVPVFWRRRFRSMAKARANHAEEVG